MLSASVSQQKRQKKLHSTTLWTCQERCLIGTDGERESKEFMLSVCLKDDNDDDDDVVKKISI